MKQAWDEIESLFHAALELPADRRRAFIDAECNGDAQKAAEVTALVESFESDRGFLDDPVFEAGLTALEKLPETDLSGRIVGDYIIQERIGVGGMGEVYRALDSRLDRPVALKFVSDQYGSDRFARRRLEKEARAAAALDHPNICAVYGLENIDGLQFIVMQHIDGVTLDEYLRERNIGDDDFRPLARQIVGAVGFAHSHGIIHRDIKPGNIMVTSDGHVRVLDFGLAKSVDPKNGGPGDSSIYSNPGLIVGTVAYMSPEQLRGERLDFRSDIFSLGVVFCEMLTGRNPFARSSQAETIAAVLGGTGTCPDLGASGAFGGLISRCLSRDPADRPGSMAEVAIEIETPNIPVGSNSQGRFPLRRLLVLPIAAIIFAIVYGILGSGTSELHSLAVLPARIDGDLTGNEYLVKGIVTSLTERMGTSPNLRVRSEYLAAGFQGSQLAPASIGKALKVDAVVESVFYPRDGGIRLRMSLIRVADGLTLRSEEYLVDEDMEKVAGAVSASVVESLRMNPRDLRTGVLRGETENPEARKHYTFGRILIGRKAGNDVERAIDAFTNATQLDPGYAKAWAGLADSFLAASMPGVRNSMTPKEAGAKAKRAVEIARGLDPGLSETYNTLGQIALRIDWDWEYAEASFRKAIQLNPEFPAARTGLISTLNITGRFDEALAAALELKAIDPTATADIEIAKIQYRKRDFSAMRESMTQIGERFPFNNRLQYIQSYELLATGEYLKAIGILQPLYDKGDETEKILMSAPLGFAYARAGDRERALRLIADLSRPTAANWVPSQEQGIIYVGLRDIDRAFSSLERSCNERFQSLPPLITDPLIDDLKPDPRFRSLMECVGLR